MPSVAAAELNQPEPPPQAIAERIDSLDTVRGLAVLGILIMNAVSYGAGTAAYFNLDSHPSASPFDWVIGTSAEILVDQKFMGLFSLLFGAGILLFHERALAKGLRASRLTLRRIALLFLIGLVHGYFWDGDILLIYAIAAPAIIAARKLWPATLILLGILTFTIPPILAIIVQEGVSSDGQELGEYWLQSGGPMSAGVTTWLITDFVARAVGMMLIGAALYRTGIIAGSGSTDSYERLALWGTSTGLVLATCGVVLVALYDYSASIALIGTVPNTLGTLPACLGYLGLAILWSRQPTSSLQLRVRAVGRMALTNYLTQTLLGLIVLRNLAEPDAMTRTTMAAFTALVWALQLWWSPAWLSRFRYGPAEWLWRCATYGCWQPLRR